MRPSEYREWMQRAFLGVEGALSTELLTATRMCVTEEYLRSAMIRALMASEPSKARRVITEEDASWSNSECWNGTGKRPGQGRPIQHDIFIKPEADDKGLACEVKWLKGKSQRAIIKDIWKLALSRQCVDERSALRTYLLIGGEADAYRDTLKELDDLGVRLKWQRTDGRLPQAQDLSLNALIGRKAGAKALGELLKWGSVPTYRTPAPCRRNLVIYSRGTWLRPRDVTIYNVEDYAESDKTTQKRTTVRWNLGLWELNAEGSGRIKEIDWPKKKAAILLPPKSSKTS